MERLEEFVLSWHADGHLAVVLTWRLSETYGPLSHFFPSLLPPPCRSADLSHLLVALCVFVRVCVSLSLQQNRITLTPAADPNRDDLGFFRQPSIHPRSVSVFLAAVLFQSRLPPLSPVCVCVRVSHGWRSTCTCQVQWRWHLMPRAEIMKALTSQLKHIRLQRRGLSDTRSQHEWSEWVATLHFTCAERCAL